MVNSGGVLPIDDAVFYTCQLAEALQHAADRGIVHRDIKPSNVLISQDDKIKLVDMGLARSENFDISEDMTASGVTLGTFDYISPEQARDPRVADLRSDIYSLGCTLYFMLTGSPPYPGGTMLQKLLSHGNAPPPDARKLRPHVSDDLVIVINKMLAKDPEDRYASGNDLVADLREVAYRDGLKRSQGIAAAAIAEPNRVATWLEQHAPWLIAATLLLLSTAWLQVITTASRDEFEIPIPSNPTIVREVSPAMETPDDLSQSDRSTRPGSTDSISTEPPVRGSEGGELILNAANPASSDAYSDSTSVGADQNGMLAQPPRLNGVPIPPELDDRVVDASVGAMPAGGASDLESDQSVTAEPRQIRLIRLVDPDSPMDGSNESGGVGRATTFSQALSLAKRHEVDRIEIATPIVRTGPIRIEQDGLLITAAAEVGECVIEFQHRDSITMRQRSMFDIGSNRIEIEDVHFVWKMTSGDIDGGALMTVKDNRLVRMTDCSITVDNPSRIDPVYVFDFESDSDSMSSSSREIGQPEPQELSLVAIELNNVIIRGQTTMIHMREAVELQLQWDNGLLAINQRMIDTMGSSFPPNAQAMQLSLTRLTALVPQGLVRMRLGIGGQYPIAIDREARSCVFVVDEGTPHVEISGLSSFGAADGLLTLRGEANAYDVDPTLADPFLLLSDTEGQVEITRMDDLKSDTPYWSDEKSPRWFVRWATLGYDGEFSEWATSRLTPDDFLQYGTVFSGFDPDRLPRFPEGSDRRDESDPGGFGRESVDSSLLDRL